MIPAKLSRRKARRLALLRLAHHINGIRDGENQNNRQNKEQKKHKQAAEKFTKTLFWSSG